MVTVRYFAAAAEAAGLEQEPLDTSGLVSSGPGSLDLGALRAALVARHGAALERVLGRCSFLVDGVRAGEASVRIPDGATVDVLPPFAGG
ncbi:MoaD/ThiS family protein [Agromyces protaetiae]|uniref:MoaD/ThiS family protein n=1 Tax=Agromyces protaetiae TaxID=2509455 RepID=UPI001FB76C1A|nr:MoaD/ThiS family protein [Agromyces protaetiae]